jgi:hypothetical protein
MFYGVYDFYPQVKRDPPHRNGNQKRSQRTTWIEKKIYSHVMGQIGMELLCESSASFISPSVAGIACFRSEVINTF